MSGTSGTSGLSGCERADGAMVRSDDSLELETGVGGWPVPIDPTRVGGPLIELTVACGVELLRETRAASAEPSETLRG